VIRGKTSFCLGVAGLLLCGAAGIAGAQTAVVTRNVNLRAGPSTSDSILRLLHPPDEVTLLDPVKHAGYFEVRTAGGTHGWVWANNIRVTPLPPAVVGDSALMGPPPVYRGCPLEGSAIAADFRASNAKKNRLRAPVALEVDSAATLAALLARGGAADWNDGRGASIVGYVYRVKPGGEETVNCGDTAVLYKDTHIELVEDPSDTRAIKRLIVEVTPRWRAFMADQGLTWSTDSLRLRLQGKWVRFTGWLFWDFSHADEAELTHPGGTNNWRATAWEVHPVTAIRVCAGSPGSCD
jgi:Bacterial SH3 domain